jgi:hypothetical protein
MNNFTVACGRVASRYRGVRGDGGKPQVGIANVK